MAGSRNFRKKIIDETIFFEHRGQLNYFVSRAYYKNDTHKHKNPQTSKDIIGFEMLINWNEPIILCEGAFDAITIKRNAIPLFGKIIQPVLQKKIIEEHVKDIYICLDSDAINNAIEIAKKEKQDIAIAMD